MVGACGDAELMSAHAQSDDATKFELFGYWYSSATYRVRVALNIKGIAVRERMVNLDAAEQRSESFLAVNPLGGVPVLVEAGRSPLLQSTAILEFLDDIQPSPPLLPSDSYGRARVRSIAAMLTADTHPLVVPRVRTHLIAIAGFDDAALRDWRSHWFGVGLAAVEARLLKEAETGRFCHGDRPTTADICLASVIAVTRIFKIATPDIPAIDRIISACDAEPAFQKADPLRQQGARKA